MPRERTRMVASTTPVRRVVRVVVHGRPAWGVVDGDEVDTLTGEPWSDLAERGERLGRLDELEQLASVSPSKIVCIGRNYRAHAEELGSEVPAEPALFLKPPSSLIGPQAAVVCPPQSARVEHEAELGVVIGRHARDVTADRAWRHVLGITCGNDVTARDLQRSDVQWTRAKGFDTFCPVGPWLVTGLDEEQVGALEITCRVNGVVRQRASTGSMVFPPAELIAYISSVMTLEPGDLVLTGTPAGVGPLSPGDTVEVEIEGIGVLRNSVRSGRGTARG